MSVLVEDVHGSAKFISPKFSCIPSRLKEGAWGVWRAEPRPEQLGKFNKAPISPITGLRTSVQNPEKFGSFDDAKSVYEETGRYTGIGRVLCSGEGIVGFDIDDVHTLIKAKPNVESWVCLAARSGAYIEKSPSGKGLRLFVLGRLPDHGRKSGGLEIYDQGRFLTVTGHVGKFKGRPPASDLIDGQELIDAFLKLLPNDLINKSSGPGYKSDYVGPKDIGDLSKDVRGKVADLIGDIEPVGTQHIRDLFDGDMCRYEDDHSRADLALISHLKNRGLTAGEADLVFRTSMLYRGKWDEWRGSATYGELTINRSYSDALEPLPICEGTGSRLLADSVRFTPLFYELGMEPRRFLGPEVMPGVRLFPAEGLTTISALGASGKTTFIVNIGAHIAAGRDWNGAKVSQRRVAIFSVEETQDELNRKFSATVEDWADSDRFEAIKNLRLISLQGVDARLTQITGRQVEAGGFSDEVINFCRGFGLEDGVVFLDHYQGLVSGDLNLSDTATGFCREANKIAVTLKSAVVILSHTSKQNMSISSADITQGHSSGSLAFENAMRQTIVMVAMTKDEAKNYGLDESDLRYVWLGLPKNSYGSTNAGVWMEKSLSQRFHTIRFCPVALEKLKKRPSQTGEERIRGAIVDYVREHPWKTKNAIEKVAGMKSSFRASSKSVRSCIEGLLAEGMLSYYTVGVEERNKNGLAKQVREVLRVSV